MKLNVLIDCDEEARQCSAVKSVTLLLVRSQGHRRLRYVRLLANSLLGGLRSIVMRTSVCLSVCSLA